MFVSKWYDRVQGLRELAAQEPHRAGMEALRIFEEWLYEKAQQLGYRKARRGMRAYLDIVAKRGGLSQEEAARGRRYVELRNCLSHRAGLAISPALADELLDFVAQLFRSDAWLAEQIMTCCPHTVREADSLREARDWMLSRNISHIPVVEGEERVIGLLTNRDILTLQASLPDGASQSRLTVADAVRADALEKILFVPRQATYDEVLAELQKPNVVALFVTDSGSVDEPLEGVITISDILPKL